MGRAEPQQAAWFLLYNDYRRPPLFDRSADLCDEFSATKVAAYRDRSSVCAGRNLIRLYERGLFLSGAQGA